jgi:hypothetical protein
MDLSEGDFDGSDLGKFTFIGKRILKRILQVRHFLFCVSIVFYSTNSSHRALNKRQNVKRNHHQLVGTPE